MKNFLAIFFGTFAVVLILLSIGGSIFLENIWAAIFLFVFIISTGISSFLYQENKIDDLENRLSNLESISEKF